MLQEYERTVKECNLHPSTEIAFVQLDKKVKIQTTRTTFDMTSGSTGPWEDCILIDWLQQAHKLQERSCPEQSCPGPGKESVVRRKLRRQNSASLIRSSIKRMEYHSMKYPDRRKDPDIVKKINKLKTR